MLFIASSGSHLPCLWGVGEELSSLDMFSSSLSMINEADALRSFESDTVCDTDWSCDSACDAICRIDKQSILRHFLDSQSASIWLSTSSSSIGKSAKGPTQY
jgi:hypothetical protein